MSVVELRRTGRFLGSEVRLMMGRWRNIVGLVVLASVPIMIAVVTKVSGGDSGGGPVSSIFGNGLFVPLMALFVESTFFLPLAISMLAGDALAAEAQQGTIRYLLTVPVNRTRLLIVKYLGLVIGAIIAVAVIAIVGAIIGVALFGAGSMISLSGTTLSFGASLGRLGLVSAYLVLLMAAIAAIGLFISTLTEQPIAATVAVMVVVILSWIVEGIPQLSWLAPWLLTHWVLAFMDLLRDPMMSTNVLQGVGLACGYIGVFFLAAWARFTNKDITS